MPNIFSRPQTSSPSSTSSFGSFFNRINSTVQEISALIDAAAAADDTHGLTYSPEDVPSPDDVLQYLYVTPPERDITRFPEGNPDTLIPDLKRSRSATNLRTPDNGRPSHNGFLTPPQPHPHSHGGRQAAQRINPSPLKIADSDAYSISSSRDSTPLATPTSSTFMSPPPSLRTSLSTGDIRSSFVSASDKGTGSMAQLHHHPNYYQHQPVRIVGSAASDRLDRPPPPPAKPRVALPSEIIYPNGRPTHLAPTHSRPSYSQHKPVPSVPLRAPAPSPTTPTTPVRHPPSRSPTSQQPHPFPQQHPNRSNPPSHSPSPSRPAFFEAPPPQQRHTIDPSRQVDPEQIISRLSHAGLINQSVWDRQPAHFDHATPSSYASPQQLPYEPRRRRTPSRTSSIASSIASVSVGSSSGHGHGYGYGGPRTPSLVSTASSRAPSSYAPSAYAPSSYAPSVSSSSRNPSRQSSLASSIAPIHPLNPPSPAENIHAFLSYHAHSSPSMEKQQPPSGVGLGLWLPPGSASNDGEYYCDGEDPFAVSSPVSDPYSMLPSEALEFLSPTSITLSLEKDLPPPPPLALAKPTIIAPMSEPRSTYPVSTNPFRPSASTNPFRPSLVLNTSRPVAHVSSQSPGVFVIGDEDEDEDEDDVVRRSPRKIAEEEVDVAVKECLTPLVISSPMVMHFPQEVGAW